MSRRGNNQSVSPKSTIERGAAIRRRAPIEIARRSRKAESGIVARTPGTTSINGGITVKWLVVQQVKRDVGKLNCDVDYGASRVEDD
jgi:hypothetical protein